MNNSIKKIFDNAPALPPNTYVILEQYGACKICMKFTDLRCGVCFNCARQVSGRRIDGGHELWDSINPSNKWIYMEEANAK